MFLCKAKPATPNKTASDGSIGIYIVRLRLAHEDCEGQLMTVKNHLEVNGVTVTDVLQTAPAQPKAGRIEKLFKAFKGE